MRAIAGVLLLVGCGAPAVVLDGQPCDDAGACPGEQTCEPDGVCRYEPATSWIELVPGPELGVRLPGPGALAVGDLGGDGATDVVYGLDRACRCIAGAPRRCRSSSSSRSCPTIRPMYCSGTATETASPTCWWRSGASSAARCCCLAAAPSTPRRSS